MQKPSRERCWRRLCFRFNRSTSHIITLILNTNFTFGYLYKYLNSQKYQPYATDPNLSGAFASVLWELNLLTKHYHPAISTMAGTISNMNTSQNQTFLSAVTPQQAFADYSLLKESFEPKSESRKLNNKRKRESGGEGEDDPETDMVELKKKLKENFTILRGIKVDERVRMEFEKKKQSNMAKKKPTKKQSNVEKKKPKSPKSKKKF